MKVLDETQIHDTFPDEHLKAVEVIEEDPWYADFVNCVSGIIFKDLTYQQEKKCFFDINHFFWDELYLFRHCEDNIVGRCVFGNEARKILAHCHEGPTRGYHGAFYTANNVFEADFIGLQFSMMQPNL